MLFNLFKEQYRRVLMVLTSLTWPTSDSVNDVAYAPKRV